jgi:hypothetical protein
MHTRPNHTIYHITSRSSTRWLIPSSQSCHRRRKAISVRPRPRRSLSAVQRPRPDQTKITFPSLARWQGSGLSVPIASGQLARLAHSPNGVCDARSPAIAGHAPSLRPPRRCGGRGVPCASSELGRAAAVRAHGGLSLTIPSKGDS